MWVGGVHFNCEACKLVGIAFLENSRKFRWFRVSRFLEVESAGHAPKAHFPIDLFGAIGIVFVKKGQQFGTISTVKCFQPRLELVCRRRVRCFGLRLVVFGSDVLCGSVRSNAAHGRSAI